ncbi:MAG: 6-pyruvoyl tetrahydropterin synthase family protein [Haloferacaceae archaeon]
MYEVMVVRTFDAWHWLTVPDPGPEGERHSHTFTAEMTLRGPDLNEYGYLVDIDAVHDGLDAAVERYEDETMNDLSEFAGLNPSAERLARFIVERFDDATDLDDGIDCRLRLWEDDDAAVTYDP